MTDAEIFRVIYEISKFDKYQEREFFRQLQPALTEEEALRVILAASALRLMANKQLQVEMGRAMYDYFLNN